MDKGYYKICIENILVCRIPVAIHNKNGQGLLLEDVVTISITDRNVAIHNKNGQGFLRDFSWYSLEEINVAIHNKNGQGFLQSIFQADWTYQFGRNPQ